MRSLAFCFDTSGRLIFKRVSLVGLCACLVLLGAVPLRAAYDPLALTASAGATLKRVMTDTKRQREIPLLVYLPSFTAPAPVVLFSHGLGGTREGSAYLGRHWSARGYVAVFLQHPGSDEGVWKGVEGPKQRFNAMQEAASAENFKLRVQDVKTVLDQLEKLKDADPELKGKLDLTLIAMSGHSFGAVTTQALSGQSLPLGGASFQDPRIAVAIVMSPSMPRKGQANKAFGSVKIPWLLMTGTEDLAPIGGADMASRLGVYPALPKSIAKYELVLDGAKHHAFTDREQAGLEQRDGNDHRVILALSTAFLDTHLRKDKAAAAWLHGAGPREVLAPADRWQFQLP